MDTLARIDSQIEILENQALDAYSRCDMRLARDLMFQVLALKKFRQLIVSK